MRHYGKKSERRTYPVCVVSFVVLRGIYKAANTDPHTPKEDVKLLKHGLVIGSPNDKDVGDGDGDGDGDDDGLIIFYGYSTSRKLSDRIRNRSCTKLSHMMISTLLSTIKRIVKNENPKNNNEGP